jgi:hypothetical protein
MYEYVSNCDAVLRTSSISDAAVIDEFTLSKYRSALGDIVNKAVNGELKPEDKDKLNMVTEDIWVIYRYIFENDRVDDDKFSKEVGSKLKLKYPY